jgi:hypothetical protein
MEVVRQIIDSELLHGILPLPKSFQRKQVEVIVFVKEEKSTIPQFSLSYIDSLFPGSITESLIGIIPNTNKTLDDYRSERLSKYETSN